MCDAVPWVVDVWHAIVHGHIHFSWDNWNSVYDSEHRNLMCINLRWSLECRSSSNWKVSWRIERLISLLLSQSALWGWNFMCTNYIKHSIFRKVCYCFLLHRHPKHSWSDGKNFRARGIRRDFKLLPNLATGTPKRARALQPCQLIASAVFLWLRCPV